jgi:hypothetical protein
MGISALDARKTRALLSRDVTISQALRLEHTQEAHFLLVERDVAEGESINNLLLLRNRPMQTLII